MGYRSGALFCRDHRLDRKDLIRMDVKTRKTLSMAGAFHTRGSSLRLYIKRKEGGKGLISVEDCVKMERANLKSYLSDSEEWLLKEVAAMDLVKNVESASDFKKRVEAERKGISPSQFATRLKGIVGSSKDNYDSKLLTNE